MRGSSVSAVLCAWVQPTLDSAELRYLLLKKNLHVSGHAQFKAVVQGSTVLKVYNMTSWYMFTSCDYHNQAI